MATGQIVVNGRVLESRLMQGDTVAGITKFAIGTGDGSWNVANPPVAKDVGGNSLDISYSGSGLGVVVGAGALYFSGTALDVPQTILDDTTTPAIVVSQYNHIMVDNAGVFTVTATSSATTPTIPSGNIYIGYVNTDATVVLTIYNQANMVHELARVSVVISFIDLQGDVTLEATNRIRVTATFGAGVGTGDIMEFALFGGAGDSVMIAYKTVQVIHKLSTNALNVVWDLSF